MCNPVVKKNASFTLPRSQKMTPRVSSLEHSPCGVNDKRVFSMHEDHHHTHAEALVMNGEAAVKESGNATLAIPRQVSITSSSSSLKSLERQDSSASVSSLSSFGTNGSDASSSSLCSEVRVAPTPPPPPPLPPLSPRRAIFKSYWMSPNNAGARKKTSGQLVLFNDVKEQEKTKSPLPVPVPVPVPPPPPLVQAAVQADANLPSPCLHVAVSAKKDDIIAKDMSPRSHPRDKSPTSRRTCRRSIFGSSHRTTTCSSSTTSTSSWRLLASIKCDPKLHLTKVGPMLAEHKQNLGSDRGVTSRNVMLTDPSSPSKLVSPSILRPCLKRGSSWTRSNAQEYSAGTCPSISSSSSEALHDSLNGSEANVHEGRGRSNSAVSFCPTVSVIEFDNSKEVKDEELIRASRPNKDGWSSLFSS